MRDPLEDFPYDETPPIEDMGGIDLGEVELKTAREHLATLEAEHKARVKDLNVTPEQHYESALKISKLRAEIREIEELLEVEAP